MSGIYIPGMKMPKAGYCFIVFHNGEVWGDGKRIGKVATAVELPPHGRLIDADKLYKSIQAQTEIIRKWGIDELTEIADLLEKGFLQEIENADTIIPADPEGGADNG